MTEFPVERSFRVSDAIAFNGIDATYGPFDFKIFDPLDVRIETRDIGESLWLPTDAFTVSKGPDDADYFTVTFNPIQSETKEFRVVGARLHERSIALSKGAGISIPALAKIHAQITFTLQELRRDVDAQNSIEVLEAAAVAVEAAEQAVSVLGDVEEAKGLIDQIKSDVQLLKEAANQARIGAEKARDDAIAGAAEVLGSGRVPVGFMAPWFSLRPPNQYWVLVDRVGQVFSRAMFPQLFDVLAPEFTVSFSDGDPVVTGIVCPQKLKAGWPVEGENIPPGTTILSVDSPSQITLSANPTGDGTTIRVFPHGNGDGSTTANYPAVAGRVVRGLDADGVLNPDAANAVGEVQEDALQQLYGQISHTSTSSANALDTAEGVFKRGEEVTLPQYVARANGSNVSADGIILDASLVARTSDETRAKAVIAPYIIKVADGVDDEATLSALQVVQDLAQAQADIAALQANSGEAALLAYQQPSGVSGGNSAATSERKPYVLN
ncbi:hypothetical protein FMN50_20255, partial [Rhodobacterales bacterium]